LKEREEGENRVERKVVLGRKEEKGRKENEGGKQKLVRVK